MLKRSITNRLKVFLYRLYLFSLYVYSRNPECVERNFMKAGTYKKMEALVVLALNNIHTIAV